MTRFFDTSVLVAAMVGVHPHHERAAAEVAEIVQGRAAGGICTHSLAELYAVLTRLPLSPAIHPSEAWRLIEENVLAHFEVTPLTLDDYRDTLRLQASHGMAGGLIYDALLLRAAERQGADIVLTFNIAHFRRLAQSSAYRGRVEVP